MRNRNRKTGWQRIGRRCNERGEDAAALQSTGVEQPLAGLRTDRET